MHEHLDELITHLI